MDVVLVAAKKDYIRDYTDLLSEVGLEPVVCDVDAFAIETMFLTNYAYVTGQSDRFGEYWCVEEHIKHPQWLRVCFHTGSRHWRLSLHRGDPETYGCKL